MSPQEAPGSRARAQRRRAVAAVGVATALTAGALMGTLATATSAHHAAPAHHATAAHHRRTAHRRTSKHNTSAARTHTLVAAKVTKHKRPSGSGSPGSGSSGSGSAGSSGSGSAGASGSGSPASGSPASGSESSGGTWWMPSTTAPISWQWELAHPLGLGSTADLGTASRTFTGAAAAAPSVYDIDGFDNPASTVAGLHALGARVICYVDVGTWENWRPDAAQFPAALLGKSNGWPGEKWLNISPAGPNYAQLQAIMMARFQMCKNAGYDAVEPDNIDGSENSTGFTITTAQNNAYVEWIAAAVHGLGMSVGQKNYVDQSAALAPSMDFAVDEQCFQYGECSGLAPYLTAKKAVFEVEYSDQGAQPANFCPAANAAGMNSVEFTTSLNGSVRVPCR
jgi:hypothetical protein